jgi:hypothetical protein
MKLRLIATVALAVAGLVAVPSTAQAAANGSISGTVTESTVPAADVYVGVIGIIDQGFFGKGPGLVADTFTDAAGHYTVSDLPPSGSRGYWVCYVPDDWPFGTYDSQCFDQTGTFFPFPSGAGFLDQAPGSKAVSLTAGQHRTGIDGDLQPVQNSTNGGITGRVSALGLLPVRHAKVTVDQNGTPAGATFSAGNGTYRVTGLAPGTYHVCFDGSTAGHYSTTCRRALVAVKPGLLTKGINGVLTVGR